MVAGQDKVLLEDPGQARSSRRNPVRLLDARLGEGGVGHLGAGDRIYRVEFLRYLMLLLWEVAQVVQQE